MAKIVRIPRHSTATRNHRLRAPRIRLGVRALLASAAAVLAGILIAVAGTAGSYALWNQAAPIADTTVTSGSLGLTIKHGSGAAGSSATLPTGNWTNLLPGDFADQQVTLANTGNATGTLTARLGTATPYQIRLASGPCPGTQLTATPLSTTAGAVGTIAGGASQTMCVQVALPITAASNVSGTSSSFTLTIEARS